MQRIISRFWCASALRKSAARLAFSARRFASPASAGAAKIRSRFERIEVSPPWSPVSADGSIDLAAIRFLQVSDQAREQAPEIVLARIAADAADLAALVDEHEHRRDALDRDPAEVGWDRRLDVDPAQPRSLALVGLCVDRRDLAVELRAVGTACARKHHQLG